MTFNPPYRVAIHGHFVIGIYIEERLHFSLDIPPQPHSQVRPGSVDQRFRGSKAPWIKGSGEVPRCTMVPPPTFRLPQMWGHFPILLPSTGTFAKCRRPCELGCGSSGARLSVAPIASQCTRFLPGAMANRARAREAPGKFATASVGNKSANLGRRYCCDHGHEGDNDRAYSAPNPLTRKI